MYKFESVAFPGLFLSVDQSKLIKQSYQPTNASWKITDDDLINVYNNVYVPLKVITSGAYVTICDATDCLDAYDGSNRVEYYRPNQHRNQLWIMTSGDPVTPNISYISSLWTPVDSIKQLQLQDYRTSYRQRLQLTKIFYLNGVINPLHIPAYMTHIPTIDINGDRHVILPDQKNISPLTVNKTQQYNLLSYRERRIARKMVIISQSKVFAHGWGAANVRLYDPPRNIHLISLAGPQFEFRKLEFNDFIVIRGAAADPKPLFPHYYADGIKPSFDQASQLVGANAIKIDNDLIFLSQAYMVSAIEDITLILTAFNSVLTTPTGTSCSTQLHGNCTGWLKLTAVGMGFFAKLDMKKSIAGILVSLFLQAFHWVASNLSSKFNKIKVVEFPDYGGSYKPYWGDQVGSFRTVHTYKRDILLLTGEDANYQVGVVNPADVMSYKGNEPQYASGESMIGNNTDLRYNQVAVFNPYLLQAGNYVSVNRPV